MKPGSPQHEPNEVFRIDSYPEDKVNEETLSESKESEANTAVVD